MLYSITYTFKDLEMNQDWNICIDDNGATLGRCVYACDGNESCEADCIDSFKNRQANCPCEVPIQRSSLYLTFEFRKIASVAALVITTPVLKRPHRQLRNRPPHQQFILQLCLRLPPRQQLPLKQLHRRPQHRQLPPRQY